jgi:hypothetical protein
MNATSNDGGEVVLKLRKDGTIRTAIATGKFSNHFKAETDATKTADGRQWNTETRQERTL